MVRALLATTEHTLASLPDPHAGGQAAATATLAPVPELAPSDGGAAPPAGGAAGASPPPLLPAATAAAAGVPELGNLKMVSGAGFRFLTLF